MRARRGERPFASRPAAGEGTSRFAPRPFAAPPATVVQRSPSALKARFGGDPQMNLQPYKQMMQPEWNAYAIQVKQYLPIPDDEAERQVAVFPTVYHRTRTLSREDNAKYKPAQRNLAAEINGALEEEKARVMTGGSGVLGTDLLDDRSAADPALRHADAAYEGAGEEDMIVAPLFNLHLLPSIADVKQGNLGDCYLLAAVASIVQTNPEHFVNHMKDNLDGTVTVRLYSAVDTPVNVKVRKTVAGERYAKGALWVKILEKAYAASGLAGARTYAAIEGGSADVSLLHLTGKRTRAFAVGRIRQSMPTEIGAANSAYKDRLQNNIRQLSEVVDKKKKARQDAAAEEREMLARMTELAQIDKTIGSLLEKLELRYVSRRDMAAFLAQIQAPPALERMILERTDPLLPGELGSGDYGPDELQLFAMIRSAVNDKRPATISTKLNIQDSENPVEAERGLAGEAKVSGLAARHEYSVVGYKSDPDGQTMIKLRNPWGKYGRRYVKDRQGRVKGVAEQEGTGVFEIDLADLVAYFQSFTYVE